MDVLINLGIILIQIIQRLSPALDAPMNFFTFIGRIEFYLILVPLVYWVIDSRLGIRLLFILLSVDIIGATFKQILHQPRPYWIGGVKALSIETSYGIPSTHASDSLAVWGAIAFWARKTWVWILAVALVLLISFSRLYLGVHFPHDLLGGWLVGGLVLYLYIQVERSILPWLKALPEIAQIGLGFAVSVIFILLGYLVLALIASTPDPESWAQFATQARTVMGYYTLAGALFGTSAGLVLMQSRARFQTEGSGVQKAARYLLGMVGVLVLYFGLDQLFALLASDESAAGYVLRYLRYVTVTFYTVFGAPWVFLKLKLAKPASGHSQAQAGKTSVKPILPS